MTRYYDPEICRFVNADALSYKPSVINGCNLYAYCNNNPVTGYDPDGTFDWEMFWDIAINIIADSAAAAAGIGVSALTGNIGLGIAAFIGTLCLVNNAVNFVYYTWISDGNSSLTTYSYSGNKGDSSIYLTRWQRLDYTKQQLQNSWYTPNAWRYYSEYSFHMYGWLFASIPILGNIVSSKDKNSLQDAHVDVNKWDGRWYVNVFTILLGLLGI